MTALLAGACAKAHAKGAPDGPPLEMPQPPPRVVVAMEEPIPSAPPEEAAVTAPASPRPAAPPATRATPRPEPKVEPPPAASAATDGRLTESRTLRAPGDNPSERTIRDRLSGASRDLARVNYSRLTAGGRTQYEQSKRFIQQAEQALKDQNLVFAATLADKAATLAAELVR